MSGFLGTNAPLEADINLVIQLLMGIALVVGMILARLRRYRAHGFCQASVVLLNLIMIFLIMSPSFREGVLPELPASLSKPYYSVSTAHAGLGITAELLGLYIILRAGTNLLPRALCFRNYKLWMRTTLVLWWVVIVLGIATYYLWY